MRYTGLDDLTDFIVTWIGPNFERNFAWALPKGDGPAFFVNLLLGELPSITANAAVTTQAARNLRRADGTANMSTNSNTACACHRADG